MDFTNIITILMMMADVYQNFCRHAERNLSWNFAIFDEEIKYKFQFINITVRYIFNVLTSYLSW